MRQFLFLVVIVFFGSWLFGYLPGSSETAIETSSPVDTAERSTSITPQVCATGGAGSGDVVAVLESVDLRDSPSENGKKIKNVKASEALGKTHYHQVDQSTSVRQLCVEGEWSQVQIVTPEWLNQIKGWIPSRFLHTIETSSDGQRIYVESDFLWDGDTSKFKSEIVVLVNKIAQQHSGCSALDTASVAMSPSRSKPGDPVFFVTCDPSGAAFNVWFRPLDADKKFAAAKAISQGDAILECEKSAKAAAAHPSTVDFSRILDVAYSARQDGRVSLDTSFTAKNNFNLELKYHIRCLFDGRKLIESNIAETQ